MNRAVTRHKMPPSWYGVLGVSPHCTDDDVRRAYLALAKRWHPDRHPRDPVAARRHFMLAGQAYRFLKTRPQRQAYNRYLMRQAGITAPTAKKSGVFAALCDNVREIIWPLAPREKIGTIRHG